MTTDATPGTPTIRRLVEEHDVVVCCGSGGVGKTTTAAVVGLEAARRGRRAVVVTIDPARRLADALGLVDGLAPEPQRVDVGAADGELWAMMLDPAVTFDGLVERYAQDPDQVERITSNSFYRNMAGAMSGTQEYMAAEMLHALDRDDRFDLVVVDTPPSRSALDFLEAPGVLSRFLDHRLFKLAMLPTRSGLRLLGTAAQPLFRAIGKVVGSDVLADALAFFQAFAGMESGFRERADEVVELLRSERTGFAVVASPRRDTIAEAVWFADRLRAQEVTIAAGIVNRVHPDLGERVTLSDLDLDLDLDVAETDASDPDGVDVVRALCDNLDHLAAVREAEIEALEPLRALIAPAPFVLVPLLPADVHDLEALDRIGAALIETP